MLASVGGSGGPVIGIASVAAAALAGAAIAGPWLAAAYGYGRLIGVPLLGRCYGGGRASAPGRFAVGAAVMLALGHLIGVLGLLTPAGAWAVVLPGAGAAVWSIARDRRGGRARPARPARTRWVVVAVRSVAAVALAVGIVAASNPPGWLWGSEFGGYDALSYHLPLPREWLRDGRIWPTRASVYSFLPSHLEAAYAVGSALTFAPVGEGDLLAGGGWRLLGIQQFHLAFLVVTAWLTARAARGFAALSGVAVRARGVIGAAAGALVIATPWPVVVGSLAYNELGVTAMAAGALVIALDRRRNGAVRGAAVRGGAVGWLVGIASGVKPTALLLIGPVAGLALLWKRTPRAWVALVGVGMVAGVVALSPWLVRNGMATGNPVFPFADGLLGTGHWTAAQHERWDAAHTAGGGAIERLRLGVWTDPAATTEGGVGAPAVERHRGMSNPQWGLLWPAVGAGLVVLCAARRTRGAGVVLGGGLAAGLVAWLWLTHIQSRFLVPLVVPASIVVALAMGAGGWRGRGFVRTGLVFWLVVGLIVWQAAATVTIFLSQRDGRANLLLGVGPAFYTGEGLPAGVVGDSPARYVNRRLPDDARVLLVGGATPLYFERPMVYATAWDRSPLHALLDDPARGWSGRLIDMGITHALVDFSELSRLRASGYLDERLTPGAVRAWLEVGAEAVREWPGSGRVLFELRR